MTKDKEIRFKVGPNGVVSNAPWPPAFGSQLTEFLSDTIDGITLQAITQAIAKEVEAAMPELGVTHDLRVEADPADHAIEVIFTPRSAVDRLSDVACPDEGVEQG